MSANREFYEGLIMDLLPCPFCGMPEENENGLAVEWDGDNCCVVCLRCNAEGPCVPCFGFESTSNAEQESRRLWNERIYQG